MEHRTHVLNIMAAPLCHLQDSPWLLVKSSKPDVGVTADPHHIRVSLDGSKRNRLHEMQWHGRRNRRRRHAFSDGMLKVSITIVMESSLSGSSTLVVRIDRHCWSHRAFKRGMIPPFFQCRGFISPVQRQFSIVLLQVENFSRSDILRR